MPPVGFEPTIPVFQRAKTVHTLHCAATVIGLPNPFPYIFIVGLFPMAMQSQQQTRKAIAQLTESAWCFSMPPLFSAISLSHMSCAVRIGKEASVVISGDYCTVCLEVVKNTTNISRQRWPSNVRPHPGPRKYEEESLSFASHGQCNVSWLYRPIHL
jgi:hypothetical protein